MLAVAVLPALVSRSSSIIVDTVAAFFTVLSFCLALYSVGAKKPLGLLLLSAAAAGFAFASKYPAGAALVVCLVVIALEDRLSAMTRSSRVFFCGLAFSVAAVVAMPALLLNLSAVSEDITGQWGIYAKKATKAGYFQGILRADQVGPFVLIPCLLGIVVAARRCRATMRFVTGLGLYYAISLSVLLKADFQPFRNVLPLVCSLVPFFGVPFGSVSASRRWASRAAVAVGLLCLAPSTFASFAERDRREHLSDSRILAREWVNENLEPGSRVLVTRDLGFLPSELEKFTPPASQISVQRLKRRRLEAGEFVVTSTRGSTVLSHAARSVAAFGSGAAQRPPKTWKRNAQRITIFRIEDRLPPSTAKTQGP
jgi:hypothetical protein